MKHFYLTLGVAAVTLAGAGCRVVQPQVEAPTTVLSSEAETVRTASQNYKEYGERALEPFKSQQFLGPEDVNAEPATTTVTFTDFRNGFKVEVPYNPNWKIGNVTPHKHELTKAGIRFGPLLFISPQGENIVFRPYLLEKTTKRSPAEIEGYLTQKTNEDSTVVNWEKLQFSGKTVYHQVNGQVCASEEFELVGDTDNFVLSVSCGASGSQKEMLLRVLDSITPLNPADKIVNIGSAGDYSEQFCGVGFGNADPDTVVEYVNREKGISLSLPYSQGWKNNDLILAPYFDGGLGISFGKWLQAPESGCDGTGRQLHLSFRDLMTKEQIIKEAKNNARKDFGISSKEYTINNLRVLEVIEAELHPPHPDEVYGYGCNQYKYLYVFGKNSVYEFSYWFDCSDKSFEELKKIITTIKLTN